MENCHLQQAGGVYATGRMVSHAGRCAPAPGSPPPEPPRALRPSVCPQAPAGDPPGDATRRHTPVGHHPKPNPGHTHPLATPQVSTHRQRQLPQHRGSPACHTARHACPLGQRRHHLTPPQGATPSPVQNTPSEPEADGRQGARQRAPLCPTAPKPSPQPSKPPNPPQTPNPS